MRICKSCFKKFLNQFDMCPSCGAIYTEEPVEPIQLMPGTMLLNRYIIGVAEGSGGFGIIYRAWDTKLDTIVAIKEFFSSRLMTRAQGTEQVIINNKARDEFQYRLARFLAEARNMAKFGSHRSIPNVFEYFEANGTAYIVMELLTGVPLNEYLREHGGKVDKDFAIYVANEVGKALCSLHEKGIIHRDVAPDNIFITNDTETRVKLLDLGAAKLADDEEEVTDIILKPGYSPPEQYDKTKKAGAWNDIYALGATLYVMLTGVKPDESTNRKIKDRVESPADIDYTISENLSNAIMKAMAIERHMRFKTVTEFLNAINGNKKIVSLSNEKKRRKRRRVSGIAIACSALLALTVVVFFAFNQKRLEKQLDAATLDVWYSAEEDSPEVAAMESVEIDFEKTFDKVNINLIRIDPDDYILKIDEAAKNSTLPALFESTNVSDETLLSASSVKNILNSEQAKSCSLLNQYNDYYSEKKRVPIGFEAPVALIVTQGESAINFDNSEFEKISDLSEKTDIAVDSESEDLIIKNFPELKESEFDESAFPGKRNNCAVLLASTARISNIKRNRLPGYTWHCAYPENDILCSYTYEWSLGNKSGSEKAAAERLLSWMLGNSYQNKLMISYAQDGQLPINDECFKEKCSGSPELNAIKDRIGEFILK